MNYRKLIRNSIQARQYNSLITFALLSGLAAGAAIAILFAPRSGHESIKLLRKKLNATNPSQHDKLFDDLREITRDHANQLQGPEENRRKNLTQIRVPSAGTSAWKKQSNAE